MRKQVSANDVSYFDADFTMEKPQFTPTDDSLLMTVDQQVFTGFSYTNPNPINWQLTERRLNWPRLISCCVFDVVGERRCWDSLFRGDSSRAGPVSCLLPCPPPHPVWRGGHGRRHDPTNFVQTRKYFYSWFLMYGHGIPVIQTQKSPRAVPLLVFLDLVPCFLMSVFRLLIVYL